MRAFIPYKITVILIAFFAFISCEKVIELDIGQAEETVVVDAVISNLPNQSIIRLSKSNPLFSSDPYTFLSDASVRIKNNHGESFLFPESEPGVYTLDDFKGIEGLEYQLDIEWKDIKINASSKMPKTVAIDSIELVVTPSRFTQNDEYIFSLKVHFTDPLDETNYYRFDIFKNDSLYNGFVVSNDLFYNGLTTYQFFMNQEMQTQDTICVQLSCIDKANYSYFLVLGQLDSPFIIAPGNPVSNLKGNAIGFFGAYAQSRKYFIVPDIDTIL